MRFPSIALIASLMISAPLHGFAKSKSMAVQNSRQGSCKTNTCPKEYLHITLKTGRKIKGDLHAEYSDRIEIHRKGKVQVILHSEIKSIEIKQTFWQKIKGAALNAFYIAMTPFAVLMLYIEYKRHPEY